MFKIVLLLNHNNLINFFKRFFYNLIEMAIQKRGTTMFERINQYLHLTVKCHLRNGKSFVGFDFHMNVVLTNSTQKSEEERQKRPQQQVCHQIREFNEFKINCEISVVQKRWTLLVDDIKTCNASLSI